MTKRLTTAQKLQKKLDETIIRLDKQTALHAELEVEIEQLKVMRDSIVQQLEEWECIADTSAGLETKAIQIL